jgi:translation initiation factor eIF-2B subunit delta
MLGRSLIQSNIQYLSHHGSRSSIVERVLLHAWEEGKRFSVVVVDSRPMLEGRLCPAATLHLSDALSGKKLLAVLAAAAIPCTYLLLPALGAIISEVTLALVGAHSLHSNGAVFSRAGTALVAMMAKQVSVPFLVCCETYKFAEGVQLDSFTKNELGEPPALLSSLRTHAHRRPCSTGRRPALDLPLVQGPGDTRTRVGAEPGDLEPAVRPHTAIQHHGRRDRGGDHPAQLDQLHPARARPPVDLAACFRHGMIYIRA